MAIATKTKAKPDVLSGLKEREQKWAEARAKAGELGTEHGIKIKAAQALVDERRRLIHRQPELVDHLGQPASKENEIAMIDRELKKLGDLQDLWAQYQHARKLEESAKQAWSDFVRVHYRELIEAGRDEAEAAAERANESARRFAEALGDYLGVQDKFQGYAIAAGLDPRSVPGADAGHEFRQVAESVDLVAPIPELPEEES